MIDAPASSGEPSKRRRSRLGRGSQARRRSNRQRKRRSRCPAALPCVRLHNTLVTTLCLRTQTCFQRHASSLVSILHTLHSACALHPRWLVWHPRPFLLQREYLSRTCSALHRSSDDDSEEGELEMDEEQFEEQDEAPEEQQAAPPHSSSASAQSMVPVLCSVGVPTAAARREGLREQTAATTGASTRKRCQIWSWSGGRRQQPGGGPL